jgi:hypothetical protein
LPGRRSGARPTPKRKPRKGLIELPLLLQTVMRNRLTAGESLVNWISRFYRMRKSLKSIFIPVFVAFSIIGAAFGQGLWASTVFCIGEAGHAAFEPVHNGTHATGTTRSEDSPHTYELSSGPGSGPCSDISVIGNDSWRNQDSKRHKISKNLPQFSASSGKIPDVLIDSFLFVNTADRSAAAISRPRAEVLRI